MRTRWLAFGLLSFVLVIRPAPLGAQAASAPLVERLREAIRDASLGDGLGVAVVDAQSGRPVLQYRASRLLNPASNMKLVTAAAALRALGPSFRMRTGVYGEVNDGQAQQGLVLRGFGDPTLDLGGLYALAQQVARQGVRQCPKLFVDTTYFDEQVLPPAFGQQPNESAAFRAAVSALSLDRNAYVLRILPGAQVDTSAEVRLVGAAYFELDNGIRTTAPAAPRVIAQQTPRGARMKLRLRGTVPLGVRGYSYRRRIENPPPWVGHAFVEMLRTVGISGPCEVEVAPGPSGMPLLAQRLSDPVAEMLPTMGKWSDNFTAEMLMRVMGAERHRPGRSEDGIAVMRSTLEAAGLPVDRIDIVNGSGLFEGNRIAPQHLADLLVHVYQDPSIRSEYLGHLAVGGEDGTLQRRWRTLRPKRVIRAKTGTLDDVIALSGYVLGRSVDRTFAFSILANGVYGRHRATRELGDRIVAELVRHLHDGGRAPRRDAD